ncbi:hypothetical protein SAMN05660420_01435 [Desulfuromusa kysingii]|uniref:Uncharacterized protein n=1 Tax=Desulfuromusa kysingii TaxID=37625 RepID=A0A1H3YXY3_9BACT|nr:hypothetical protein [Desulfuromusa kysingii]SEA16280.1 hypothetical protein SAMN05660420_01435 [Desulfuromusa kysingii]
MNDLSPQFNRVVFVRSLDRQMIEELYNKATNPSEIIQRGAWQLHHASEQ